MVRLGERLRNTPGGTPTGTSSPVLRRSARACGLPSASLAHRNIEARLVRHRHRHRPDPLDTGQQVGVCSLLRWRAASVATSRSSRSWLLRWWNAACGSCFAELPLRFWSPREEEQRHATGPPRRPRPILTHVTLDHAARSAWPPPRPGRRTSWPPARRRQAGDQRPAAGGLQPTPGSAGRTGPDGALGEQVDGSAAKGCRSACTLQPRCRCCRRRSRSTATGSSPRP